MNYWFLGLIHLSALLVIHRLYHYMARVEPFNIEVTRHEVASPCLAPELDGFTICQLSDLHISAKPRNREKIADAVRGIQADLFVLTGDLIFGQAAVPAFLEWLDELGDAIRPAVAILGNAEHKVQINAQELIKGLENRGISVLMNSSLQIKTCGTELQIVGVDDPHTMNEDFTKANGSADKDKWTLLLCHSPDGLATICNHRADLMLCGHTHGGQICFSRNGWRWPHTRRVKGFVMGWYDRGRILHAVPTATGVGRMYISRGLGMGNVPLRLNSRPEVAVFVLRRVERL